MFVSGRDLASRKEVPDEDERRVSALPDARGSAGAARASGRAVLGEKGSRRLVYPQGRGGTRRRSSSRGPARVRRRTRHLSYGRRGLSGRGEATQREESASSLPLQATSIQPLSRATNSSSSGRLEARGCRAFRRSIAPNGSPSRMPGKRYSPGSRSFSTGSSATSVRRKTSRTNRAPVDEDRYLPHRKASGPTSRASSSNPSRVAGCSGSSGWRTASLLMTPPSFMTHFVARSPHWRFS